MWSIFAPAITELPDLPPKGDVTDWKEAGHTRDEFIRIVKDTKALDPAGLDELARRWFPPARVEEEPEEEEPEPEENQLDLSLTPPPSLWNGLAQQYLELVAPATEAPESFHLGSFITAIGCLIGRDAWFCNPLPVFPNFYTLLLGPTGQGRKTTSYRLALRLMEEVAERLELKLKPLHGLASVEGLAAAMRDGDSEKPFRILAIEDEFRSLATKAQQKAVGNLIPRLAELFNCSGSFEVNTRTDRILVLNPFVSVIASSTDSWFTESVISSDVSGGFLNRWCIFPGESTKLIPFPEPVDRDAWATLIERTAQTIGQAKGQYSPSEEAKELYVEFYTEFRARPLEGLAADATARIDLHAMKFGLLYAVLADHKRIEREDMGRGILLATFILEAVCSVSGTIGLSRMGKWEQRLLQLFTAGPMSTREVMRKLRITATELTRASRALEEVGSISSSRKTTAAGRNRTILERVA